MAKQAKNISEVTTTDLEKNLIGVDQISKRNGIFTARRSYFYGLCESGESLVKRIQEQLPTAKIIDWGNHYVAKFIGGAPITKQSHYWVKFSLNSISS